MAPSDAHALATAVAGAVGDGVRRVEGVHRAITARSWRWAGALGRPSQAVHDAVSGVAYAAVGVGVVAGGAVAAQTLDLLARSRRWGDLSATPSGAAALAVLDALAGDQLERQGSPLAVPMSVRARAGGPPLADGAALADADVSGEIVLFVHGLAGWEGGWWTGAAGASGAAHADPDGAADDPDGAADDGEAEAVPVSYGDVLREALGVTPLYLRYNTGRAIAANGRDLADLLERLVATWPVPVRRLHLVGHSMGGLVIRSACHVGAERGDAWVPAVRHCVYLGTPHLGAPLARAAVALGSLLVRVPEVRPFATLLERPNPGTRDLRFGLPLADGVDEADPADWFGRDLADVPVLPSARHHAVSAALLSPPANGDGAAGGPGVLVDRVLGDMLVLAVSAAGDDGTRRLGLDPTDGAVVAPAHHLGLLGHPVVASHLTAWLGEDGDDDVDGDGDRDQAVRPAGT